MKEERRKGRARRGEESRRENNFRQIIFKAPVEA